MLTRPYSQVRAWFGDLPLRTKGLVIVLGPVGVLSLLIWILVSFVFLYRGAQSSSTKSIAILAEVHGVEARLFESLATFRSILSGAHDEYRVQHIASREELERGYNRVLELCEESDTQQVKWRLFVNKIHELERLFDKLIDLPPRIGQPTAPSELSAIIKEIDRVTRETRVVLQQFRHEESILGRERLKLLEDRQQIITRIAVLGILISFFIMGAAWRMFSSGLMSQLAALRINMDEYRSGVPLTLFPFQRDEVGTIASVFREVAGQVRQKDLEIQNFVYSVSHDLRSPLVNLEGFTRELENGLNDIRGHLAKANVDPSVAASAVDTSIRMDIDPAMHFIRTAVRRLASIVDGLLRLSRLGQLVLKIEEVRFRDVLMEIITSSRNPCNDVKVEITDDVPSILVTDRYSLEQIFGNLISNACKYSKPSQPGNIEIGVCRESSDQRGLCFYVRDNGVGIEPAHQDKVFKMFERLHPDLAPGEGMGLAFVQRVVAKLDGRIWFSSTPGEGSTFFVYLPGIYPQNSGVEGRHTADSQSPV